MSKFVPIGKSEIWQIIFGSLDSVSIISDHSHNHH